MMAFRGPLALAVATLLVLCNADPRQVLICNILIIKIPSSLFTKCLNYLIFQ